MCAKNVI